MQVAVIGDGAMATVASLLLHSQGHEVTLFCPLPGHVDELVQTRENKRYLPGHRLPEPIAFADDPVCIEHAQLLINAIPTQHIRSTWQRLAPHCPPDIPIASVAKGIETDTLLTPTSVIADVLQAHAQKPVSPDRLAAISGPTVAEELARCLPATVAAASANSQLAQQLQQIFTTQWFRVYTNDDLAGVEIAGATKNVIAIAAGILDGLQAGNNAKSALLARGAAEIARLGIAMGAKIETFFGLTGVGDLATTCFSPTGRNRSAGELLGKGQPLEQVLDQIPGVVEGVPTTRAVVTLAKQHHVEMPITEAVFAVLFQGLDPIEAISQLMSRPLKAENAD